MTLYCGTGNAGKLREFQSAAGDGIEIRSVGPRDCPETGETFEANAIQKALCYSTALADTDLLFVDESSKVTHVRNLCKLGRPTTAS